MQLGMIGLGRMGGNMVRRLTRAGHACVVFDRSADAVKEQDAATREIARNILQASRGTRQVAAGFESVSAAAQASSDASSQVLSAARELSQQGEMLRREVGTVLATVRKTV